MLMSEKLTIIISTWTILALFLTGNENYEIFFILIFIGILITRELTDVFSTEDLKDRMNIFIYIFIIIFIIIVGKKILTILGI